ncbi:hypothetical protein Ciccas_003196 [Cichlidogyrus casuarinus]|uniref:Calcium uniporter protein n=1 Tax=Cichlidogyrus casuarinus TaxID=1844966 RepID=A0ABD2QFR1_9PLAT
MMIGRIGMHCNHIIFKNQKSFIQLLQCGFVDDSRNPAYVTYENGIPCFSLPLPSRRERCAFIVKPLQHTIGDLINFVKEEDRGIDRVVFTNVDGLRFAKSTQLQYLLNSGDFKIVINENEFTVDISHLGLPKRNELDEELNNARAMVSRFHSALTAEEHQIGLERQLKEQIEDLQAQLIPFEKQREEMSLAAGRRTRYLTWFGLGAMGLQFGILARLTWWEYSWDIMEPVTYFVGYGTSIAMYAYYVVTRQEYAFPQVFDRQYLKRFYQIARKNGFDVEQYNRLCDQLAVSESDLRRLRDPLLYQLPLQQAHQLPEDVLDEALERKKDVKKE